MPAFVLLRLTVTLAVRVHWPDFNAASDDNCLYVNQCWGRRRSSRLPASASVCSRWSRGSPVTPKHHCRLCRSTADTRVPWQRRLCLRTTLRHCWSNFNSSLVNCLCLPVQGGAKETRQMAAVSLNVSKYNMATRLTCCAIFMALPPDSIREVIVLLDCPSVSSVSSDIITTISHERLEQFW